METTNSLLQDLLQAMPNLKAQVYFKTALTAISHALEDLVLAKRDRPLVIANFQQERFYRQEARRYQRIAKYTDQLYVLATPETDFATAPGNLMAIGLDPIDELAQEWHLVIVGQGYSACLICREYQAPVGAALDAARQFKGFWSFDPAVSHWAANALLKRIKEYRPDLVGKVDEAHQRYNLVDRLAVSGSSLISELDVRLFNDRLLTYLQASQYRQIKAYDKLQKANKELVAIKQTQNNLIAIVGHELRTPLSTIQVCLESLDEEPNMPERFKQVMVTTALCDSERLRRLVQDFLLLARLESNLTTWQMEPIDLANAILSVVKNFQAASKSHSLPNITVDLPSTLPLAIADGEALFQLLNKLLDNACKFTPPTGAITFQVRDVAQSDQEPFQPMLEVQITDTGRGIEPNKLERIFEQFHQEEGFLQRTVGGAGLGLAICRQLAKQLGGRIWATSEGQGLGSQFYVTIPVLVS
jgi:DICT domain-containing protein/two-component sensor histidine kinase